MAFTKSKNLSKLKEVLSLSGGTPDNLTDEQTQFSFENSNRLINVYTTGTVNGQGKPDAAIDQLVEAHIISTNALQQA